MSMMKGNPETYDRKVFAANPSIIAFLRRPFLSEAKRWRTPLTSVTKIEVSWTADGTIKRVPFVRDLDG